ncbi:2OG-Fe(II) oxygenase [Candidatus Uabimicrobium sp. HlEnr_7]|uniref:2OG-Fe(II) oxygenase n=1 Tax=Candidatus Uabimicrobium helgolandensis TaxID=3095367 RepID=UPI0035560D38
MSLDHSKSYIFTIRDILSSQECVEFIEKIDRENPKIAPINTAQGSRLKTDIRNNERIIFDDKSTAQKLLQRIRGKVPNEIHNSRLNGVNERFRGYRYKPGMRFAPHADGAFIRNEKERSYYTFLIYLNEGFEGGNTTFIVEPEISIKPETGLALFFQHPIVHEGEIVTRDVKYVLRSDVMYSCD